MANSYGKRPGSGLRKGTSKLKLKHLFFQPKNNHKLRTNYVEFNIDKWSPISFQVPLPRLLGWGHGRGPWNEVEWSPHFVGCVAKRVKQYITLRVSASTWHSKRTLYKRRHDNVASLVH